jgi:hypothetical protein
LNKCKNKGDQSDESEVKSHRNSSRSSDLANRLCRIHKTRDSDVGLRKLSNANHAKGNSCEISTGGLNTDVAAHNNGTTYNLVQRTRNSEVVVGFAAVVVKDEAEINKDAASIVGISPLINISILFRNRRKIYTSWIRINARVSRKQVGEFTGDSDI